MAADVSADGGHRRITDGPFYWIAGACGLATGVVGAAFHLIVNKLLPSVSRLPSC